MTRSASSSVSLKFGDSGDKMVVFPVLTFCKFLDPKGGLWRGIGKTCKGEPLVNLQPPMFMHYIKDCLEHDSSLKPEDLINWLTYDLDEVILDVIFMNPEFPEGVRFHTPIIGGNGPNWKTKQKEILSSHYDLHLGHCYNLDFSPLSPYNNGKFLINKGVVFVHTRLSINVYPKLVTLAESMEKSRKKRAANEQSSQEGSGESDSSKGGNDQSCDGCEGTPFSLYINNGTDVDRLGENIVQRDLDIGRHNVSIIKNVLLQENLQ